MLAAIQIGLFVTTKAALPMGLAVALALGGCATPPDLTAQVEDAQLVLADLSEALGPQLTGLAAAELQVAEAQAARAGTLEIRLSDPCNTINIDAAIDASGCVVLSNAVPDSGALNATQAITALSALSSYFAVVHDLTTTSAPADVRTQGDALVAALRQFDRTENGIPLGRLAAAAARYGPAASASAGFIAEQYRVAALRRTIQRADPVIENIVRGLQPLMLELGDPTEERRLAVTAAQLALDSTDVTRDPNAYLRAAAQLRIAIDRMHAADETSHLRRLYLLRELNAAMLDRLSHGPSLAELEQITGQIAEIATLLEQE